MAATSPSGLTSGPTWRPYSRNANAVLARRSELLEHLVIQGIEGALQHAGPIDRIDQGGTNTVHPERVGVYGAERGQAPVTGRDRIAPQVQRPIDEVDHHRSLADTAAYGCAGPAGAGRGRHVALAMMSTAGGSPSRSTVEPAVPPHFGGVVAVAVLG